MIDRVRVFLQHLSSGLTVMPGRGVTVFLHPDYDDEMVKNDLRISTTINSQGFLMILIGSQQGKIQVGQESRLQQITGKDKSWY